MQLQEDNNGFVHFPIDDQMFDKTNKKTFVYIVAFDSIDLSNNPYILSRLKLNLPGEFVTDDIYSRYNVDNTDKYFPNGEQSIPLTTCICLGWCDFTFEFKEDASMWYATFRDLTNEGRKIYYSLKKLHNNKEIRILTFNNI